jgi:hypothetical protein
MSQYYSFIVCSAFTSCSLSILLLQHFLPMLLRQHMPLLSLSLLFDYLLQLLSRVMDINLFILWFSISDQYLSIPFVLASLLYDSHMSYYLFIFSLFHWFLFLTIIDCHWLIFPFFLLSPPLSYPQGWTHCRERVQSGSILDIAWTSDGTQFAGGDSGLYWIGLSVVVMLWMEGCIVLYCIVCNCNVTVGG